MYYCLNAFERSSIYSDLGKLGSIYVKGAPQPDECLLEGHCF